MATRLESAVAAAALMLALGAPALAQVLNGTPRPNLSIDPGVRAQLEPGAQIAELSSQVVALKREMKEQTAKLNERIAATDGKVSGMDGKMTDIDTRLSGLRDQFDHHWHVTETTQFGDYSASSVPTLFCTLKTMKNGAPLPCSKPMGPYQQ